MTRGLYWISLLLCAGVGVAHSIVGLASFEPLSPNLVWFIGAGFSLLLLAALNVASWRAPRSDRLVRRMTHAANLLMTGFAIVAVRAVSGTQAYVALIAFLGLLISGLEHDRDRAHGRVDESSRGQ